MNVKSKWLDKHSEATHQMNDLFLADAEKFLEWSLRHLSEKDRKVFSESDKTIIKIVFMQGAWFGRFINKETKK